MRRYTVYRVNYATGKKEAIGCIVERRRMGREMSQNFLALLVEARELFGGGTGESIEIELESARPAGVSEERAFAREPALIGSRG